VFQTVNDTGASAFGDDVTLATVTAVLRLTTIAAAKSIDKNFFETFLMIISPFLYLSLISIFLLKSILMLSITQLIGYDFYGFSNELLNELCVSIQRKKRFVKRFFNIFSCQFHTKKNAIFIASFY